MVEWQTTWKILLFFNFGVYFINAIKILYNDVYATASNNGYWSDWLPLSHSCHQGCAISPLLFNLVVEILGMKIRQAAEVKGIVIDGIEHKGAQYADDIWLILLSDAQNINVALQIFVDFKAFSGLKTNFQ